MKGMAFFLLVELLLGLGGVCFGGEGLELVKGMERYKLGNGFRVIYKKDERSPVVAFQLWVKAGSANESDRQAGITHLIEHMVFKGTLRHPKGEIARKIEGVGGHINAYTGLEHTVYHVEVPKQGCIDALEILMDAVFHPLFDPTELELEREVVLEELRRSLDRPETILSWDFMGLCFPKHPYGRPVIGLESAIRGLSRDAIMEYVARWYTPQNTFLVVVGDVEKEKVVKFVDRFFDSVPGSEVPSQPIVPIVEPNTLSQIRHMELAQAYVEVGWPTPGILHKDTPALEVLEILLGHGRSSRFYQRLRLKERVLNSLHVGHISLKEAGIFTIFATLEAPEVERAFSGLIQELGRVVAGEISTKELETAKKKARLNTISEMESMSGQARALGYFESYFDDCNAINSYMSSLEGVTVEDIKRVAGLYLNTKAMRISILGPKGTRLPEIKGLGSFKETSDPSSVKGPRLFRLGNGIRVIVEERNDLPLASLCVVMPGGLRMESPAINGISQLASRMLLRGAGNYGPEELADAIESLGASIGTFSGKNSLGVNLKCLSKELGTVLPLLKEVVLAPSFGEEELKKVKEDILNEIKAKNDKPFNLVADLFFSTLFREHPYGMQELGTEKSVSGISRKQLVEWYKCLLSPEELVISVVGNVKWPEILNLLEGHFGHLKAPFKKRIVAPEPPLQEIRQASRHFNGHQTHLLIGFLDLPLKDQDSHVMMVLNAALSTQGGRMFRELRDEQGLAYVVSSFRVVGPETGAFMVYMACDPSKIDLAKEGILKILRELRTEGIEERELRDAKAYIIGSMVLEEQHSGQKSIKMGLDEMAGLGYDNYMKLKDKIESVSTEDIKRVANHIFSRPYAMVTVGP